MTSNRFHTAPFFLSGFSYLGSEDASRILRIMTATASPLTFNLAWYGHGANGIQLPYGPMLRIAYRKGRRPFRRASHLWRAREIPSRIPTRSMSRGAFKLKVWQLSAGAATRHCAGGARRGLVDRLAVENVTRERLRRGQPPGVPRSANWPTLRRKCQQRLDLRCPRLRCGALQMKLTRRLCEYLRA
jgi:hypothetical protein